MKKIFRLIPSSLLDDIACADGETLNADFLFENPEEEKDPSDTGDPDEPGGSDNPSGPSGPSDTTVEKKKLILTEGADLSAGDTFLAVHRPEPGGKAHIIVRQADGRLAFGNTGLPGLQPLALLPLERQVFSPEISDVRKVVGVGRWLVVLTGSSLLYARWNGTTYQWFGRAPGSPEVSFTTERRILPGYVSVPGELPRITVSVPTAGDDSKTVLDWLAGRTAECSQSTRRNIIEAVKAGFEEFVRAVAGAGLYLSPVKAAAAWALSDGALWQLTGAQTVGPSNPVTLRIAAADCTAGILYMSIEVSRAPFSLKAEFGNTGEWGLTVLRPEVLVSSNVADFDAGNISTPVWLTTDSRGFTVASVIVDEEDFDKFPATLGTMTDYGLPEDIFSIGGRLAAIRSANPQVFFSDSALPPVCRSATAVGGDGVFHITNSLRSASASGGTTDYPVYAFCRDGIRDLTPAGAGGLRESRLLSRHIACSKSGFAPLPDGTAFITSSGVMKISGTTVSCLSKALDRNFDENDRLLYIYKRDSLVVYRPGVNKVLIYSFATGKWEEGEGRPSLHHYAWPDTYTLMNGEVGMVDIAVESVSQGGIATMALTAEEEEEPQSPFPVKTRPIKLTGPFEIKQLTEVEALWPDGSQWPVKVYGALKVGKWYFLGMTTRGRMISRGSGWRFFRVETFAFKREEKWIVPTLKFTWE